MKACFVASSGGHWEELMCLRPIAEEHDTFYVTEDGGQAKDSSLENIHLLPQINRRQKDFLWRFLKLMLSAGKIMLREKPDVVVTTGALVSFPFCVYAKLLGAKVVSYNRLYERFGNLNRMLAWGHATVIEQLLEQNPGVPRMLSDQFADPSLINRALMERGREIIVEQRTKAESDIAVAAASILARDRFVSCVALLEQETGFTLPKGAGPGVKAVGKEILKKSGVDGLRRCCKNHFKTFEELVNGD